MSVREALTIPIQIAGFCVYGLAFPWWLTHLCDVIAPSPYAPKTRAEYEALVSGAP